MLEKILSQEKYTSFLDKYDCKIVNDKLLSSNNKEITISPLFDINKDILIDLVKQNYDRFNIDDVINDVNSHNEIKSYINDIQNAFKLTVNKYKNMTEEDIKSIPEFDRDEAIKHFTYKSNLKINENSSIVDKLEYLSLLYPAVSIVNVVTLDNKPIFDEFCWPGELVCEKHILNIIDINDFDIYEKSCYLSDNCLHLLFVHKNILY